MFQADPDLIELFRLFDSPGRTQLGHISRTFRVGKEELLEAWYERASS